MPASFAAFWLKLRATTIQTFSKAASAMHQLKSEVDRALRARRQSSGNAAKNKHRATERAIHPRQLSAKFNHLLRDSVHDPRNQQKLTTAARAGVEGVR